VIFERVSICGEIFKKYRIYKPPGNDNYDQTYLAHSRIIEFLKTLLDGDVRGLAVRGA
jgi:hypothetical protein